MDILTAIIPTILEYTVVPVGRQVGYLIHYKSNIENLRSQLRNFDAAKDRMKHVVDEVERKGKGVHADVQNWRNEADKITREAETFLEDESQAKTKCLHGVCPNLVFYHHLGRKSTKLVQKIELHEKREFSSVSYNAPVEEIFATPPEDYMAFQSRISMVKKIMEELRNPDTNLIGVYGTGGVGKSTLVQEVYRQAKKEKLFDDVVIVLDVKQYPELEKKERIQKKIAEKLGMDVQETQDIEVRANHLWNRIKDKKIFVILDDVWEAINLEALGLRPMLTCKILLTSRVLVSEMRTQKEFWLEVLGEEETWSLFEKMAGDVVKDGRIREVATQVAQKCGGLPVLVVAVASALRSESTLEVWKVALRRFKSFDKKGLTEAAYLALEWSYNRLDGEELKPFFLFCGIVANGCTIYLPDLLKYTMGLGLVKNVDTVEEARDTLISLCKKLKGYCLLLDIDDNGDVRMHELVQDVAIWIASKDKHALAYGDELKEWPNKDLLKKCTWMSLNSCSIPRLPEVPWVCPELRFFKLETDTIRDTLEIPSDFFKEMKELEVLDLSDLSIQSLPQSLQFLTNLQTLCLDRCELGDITLVGELTNLKVLSLAGSEVKELPKQIGQLTHLQLLDLSYCSELVQISPNVLSSLTRLEDLRMGGNSFKQWEGEGFVSGRNNASISELKLLCQLTAIDIHIPDANLLPAKVFSDKLERYTILIGDCWLYPEIYGTSSNMLKLKITTSNQFDQGIKMLAKRSEHLYLDAMDGVNVISYLLDRDGVKELKHLHVQNSADATYVINSINWSYSRNAFPKLESLSLYNLVNLESVCYGQLIAEPFQNLGSMTLWNLPKLIGFSSKGSRSVVTTRMDKKVMIDTEAEDIILENEISGPTKLFMNGEVLMPNLTSLILHQCDSLRFLFSSSMARSLVQLTYLEISKCQIMEEIVSTSEYGEENTDNMFCKLKHLQLQYLPSFTRFCYGSSVEFPTLELLHIEDCPKLGTFIFDTRRSGSITSNKENEEGDSKENLESAVPYFLFDEKAGFPSLERLFMYDLPKLMTIWHNQLAPDSFCRLRKVNIYRCHNLKNIFARSMMGRLNTLDKLEIWHCQSLQVVFEVGGALDVKETYNTSTTDQLKFFECPNLDFVEIDACQRLKYIFPASVAKGLGQLMKLSVDNCALVETVVKEEGSETMPKFVFPKVTVLKFENLPQLRVFYRGMHVSEWPLLEELTMRGCDNVEIFALEISRFQEKLELGFQCTQIKDPFFLVEKVLMPNLTNLLVHGCDGLRFLFSSSMARSVVNLKYLQVSSCEIMEEIVPRNDSNEENTYHNMFCQLKDLKLKYLPNLARFCSASYINFLSLEILHLEDCSKLEKFIFDPTSTNIKINKETEEIRDSTENLENDAQYVLFDKKVGFPSLERLIICDLPKLMTIWHHQLSPNSFCRVQKVNVLRCHGLINIFAPSMMGRLNALDTLDIQQCKSLQVVFEMGGILDVRESYGTSSTNELKSFGCPNLGFVVIGSCDSLKNIFPASMAKFLQLLSKMHVYSCGILEAIVENDQLEMTPEFVFPKVTSMRFDELPQLRSFYPGLHVSKWPLLNELRFVKCGKVEIFASEFSRFQEKLYSDVLCTPIKQHFFLVEKVLMPNLTSLIMHGCDGLRFLFSSFMASSLVQLEHLDISSCQIMEEIIPTNESSEENTDHNMFCQLKYLKLKDLPNLARFCSASYINFPSLKILHLEDCSKLDTFIFDPMSTNITINKEPEEIRGNMQNLQTNAQYFLFDEKVGFPSLEILHIDDLPKLMAIWHHQLAPNSFCKLQKVNIFRCHSLINIFAQSMMGRLNFVDKLEIWLCKSLQVVFEVGGVIDVEETNDSSTTQMKTFGSPNLDLVAIATCESLKNIFPVSVVKSLQLLRELHVYNCGILEEIVAKEGLETTPTFVFPKLNYVRFEKLPKLKSFYPGLHVSRLPLLHKLMFYECCSVEIFVSEFSRFKEKIDLGLCTPIKQPFFLLSEKGNSFPNLEELVLDKNTEIWCEAYGPLPPKLFSNLKLIDFSCAHPKSFAFLEKLHNLERLIVYHGPWKEIVVYERNSSMEIHAVGTTLPRVKKLCLNKMEELMHLGNDDSQTANHPVFPNLELLKVFGCGKLKNLTSSAISFRNLTTLHVMGCDGLKYLTTYSVAKCLQQLKNMEVEYCKSMTEIVACNGDEDSGNYEVYFSCLQHLKLSSLPSLQGFCSSENCTVRVLSLTSLIVNDCLTELKISPVGLRILSDLRPKRLQITEEVKKEKEEDGGNEMLIVGTN